jgi:hypothetical protein
MNFFRSCPKLLIAALVAIAVQAQSAARADFVAEINYNNTTTTLNTNGMTSVDGLLITISGTNTKGGASIDVSVLGTPTYMAPKGSSNIFTIEVSQTGIVTAPSPLTLVSGFSGTSSGISMATYWDPSSTNYSMSNKLASTASVTGNATFSPSGPFTLTTVITDAASSCSSVNLDDNNAIVPSTTPPPSVPAPGGLLLALAGLPLIAIRSRRRRNAATNPSADHSACTL